MQDEFELFKKKKKKADEDDEKEEDGLKSEIAAKDAAIKIKDAEIIELQGKLKDALDPKKTHDAAVKLLSVIDRASKITGKQIKIDSVADINAIRRDVVAAKLGDSIKDWDDKEVAAGFDAISVTASTLDTAVKVFGKPGNGFGHPSGSNDLRDQAYFDSVKDLENAWRPKQ